MTKQQLREELSLRGVHTTSKMNLAELQELYNSSSEGNITDKKYTGTPESRK